MPARQSFASRRWRLFQTLAVTAALAGLLSACGVHPRPYTLASPEQKSEFPEIQWCGTLRLPGKWLDDTPVGGLSDIGWDQDESLLYAVSDRGWLHRLRLAFRFASPSDGPSRFRPCLRLVFIFLSSRQ